MSNDFEAELRDRLARRAAAVDPVADVDDLGGRIRVDRRRRAQLTGAVVGGLGVLALVGVASIALRDGDGDPLGVTDAPPGQTVRSTTTTQGVTTTIAATVAPALVRPTDPASPSPTVAVPPDEVSLETRLLLEEMLDVLYEPGPTDAARLDRLVGTQGIKSLFDRIRNHELAPDIETLRVRMASVGLDDDAGIAGVNVIFTSTDQANYPGEIASYVQAEFVAGKWKMRRASFCSTVALISSAVGADIACDEDPPPSTTTTSVASNPTTTTTTTTGPPPPSTTTTAPEAP
ncbi:MAG: hypothetical protein ACT4OX_02400 [Actinomycetota bacterium]